MILFHEKLTKEKIIALILTFIGCGCITGAFAGNLSVSRETFLYGLASGFGYALYSIFGKPATKRYSALTVSLWCFLFAAAFTLPLSGLAAKAPLFSDLMVWGGILGIGLISCVFPNILYMRGLQQLEAGHAAILATIEPVVAAIVSYLFLGEAFTWQKPERRKIIDYMQQIKGKADYYLNKTKRIKETLITFYIKRKKLII